jgi:hypothetical protein
MELARANIGVATMIFITIKKIDQRMQIIKIILMDNKWAVVTLSVNHQLVVEQALSLNHM